jgi:hypothetical protein
MLRLINNSTTPPGGYRWRHEQSSKDFQAWTLTALLDGIHSYLAANSFPVPADLEARVHEYTCRGQGPGVCEETDVRYGWLSGAALKFASVIAGTEILGKWIAAGKPFVSQELADQRSETCYCCVFNVDPGDCQSCAWPRLHALVSKLLGSRRSFRHADLKACSSCGCATSVKVHVPIEHLTASFDYGEALPGHCWVKIEKENHGAA